VTTLAHPLAGLLPGWLTITILAAAVGIAALALASAVGQWLKGRAGVDVDEGQAFGGEYE
jgi:hypothetical protein